MKTFRTLVVAGACASVALAQGTRPAAPSGDDVLARSQAAYAALKSYADTGTVDTEFGPPNGVLHEHHTFTTAYRGPRHFLFDFVREQNVDRFVVWSDDEAFHTWWQATGVSDTFPKGQASGAFVAGGEPTNNALMQISPWLFPQADLTGPLTEFGGTSLAGTEAINGHSCYKLAGVGKSVYRASGRVVNVRQMNVWIDVQTLLVRRVFEDTAEGVAAGTLYRTTVTFDPQVNPMLDDARFVFTPPKGF
jgi:outer membrane lipoprotein-sorting protein